MKKSLFNIIINGMSRSDRVKLIDLKIGESLKVTNILNGEDKIKRRLNDLGITRGVIITIIGIAPLGSPVSIKLRGYNLALEKIYLSHIEGNKI